MKNRFQVVWNSKNNDKDMNIKLTTRIKEVTGIIDETEMVMKNKDS